MTAFDLKQHALDVEHRLEQPGNRHWRCLHTGVDGQLWATRSNDARVIWSCAIEDDGQPWLHTSFSRPRSMPTYADLTWMHGAFIGDRTAYQLFVPRTEHINIHEFCLHLWAPLDHAVTPPFHGFLDDGSPTI